MYFSDINNDIAKPQRMSQTFENILQITKNIPNLPDIEAYTMSGHVKSRCY